MRFSSKTTLKTITTAGCAAIGYLLISTPANATSTGCPGPTDPPTLAQFVAAGGTCNVSNTGIWFSDFLETDEINSMKIYFTGSGTNTILNLSGPVDVPDGVAFSFNVSSTSLEPGSISPFVSSSSLPIQSITLSALGSNIGTTPLQFEPDTFPTTGLVTVTTFIIVPTSADSIAPLVDPSLTSLTYNITQTPGPLPILGAGAAFGFSRKLRRRIKVAS